MRRLFSIAAALISAASAICACHCNTSACNDAQAPLIGIACSYKGANSIADNYVYSVRRAGGVPVLLPVSNCEAEVCAALDRIDAILFAGGEDVDPAWYGEEINGSVNINGLRDSSEIYMVRYAVKIGLPILGICRGEQVINVALGGSLVQDIPSQIENPLTHRQTEPGSVATQTIVLEPDSRISELLDCTEIEVNSFHHQCVKEPAAHLQISARSSDGVVEAYEGFPNLNILAVQFHPEKAVGAGDDSFLPIFTDFIERAKAYRATSQTR